MHTLNAFTISDDVERVHHVPPLIYRKTKKNYNSWVVVMIVIYAERFIYDSGEEDEQILLEEGVVIGSDDGFNYCTL